MKDALERVVFDVRGAGREGREGVIEGGKKREVRILQRSIALLRRKMGGEGWSLSWACATRIRSKRRGNEAQHNAGKREKVMVETR